MAMRAAKMLGMSGLLVLGTLACSKASADHSKVVASVGPEKITEKAFADTVRIMVGDEAKAKDVLTSEAARPQRNQLLETIVTQKALLRFAKSEGLDKDPKVQLAVEAATAQVYFQAMMEKRAASVEPTEAQLKALYDDYVKQADAAGQKASVPPFEQVKAQLPQLWKRKQGQAASDMLLTQLKQRYTVVFAPEYKPAQGAM